MLPKRIGPLVGLKVLEIGHSIAAPFCTRNLTIRMDGDAFKSPCLSYSSVDSLSV